MRYCFLIPNYNHIDCIEDTLVALQDYGFPIVMVNDASRDEVRARLLHLENQIPTLTVLHHEVNQGKGGAVQTGLVYANQQGYQYAIQVDADGQHCLDDIDTMLSLSKAHPNQVISGRPVFDESVPSHRYWARYITHFWVVVETLSTKLKDTMCGFRVYPVSPCVELIERVSLGRRMDFDIEILVRLFWSNIDTHFFDTKVIYPESGTSHFRAFEDNVLISWMHTKLFFGMLVRLPKLLYRKFR